MNPAIVASMIKKSASSGQRRRENSDVTKSPHSSTYGSSPRETGRCCLTDEACPECGSIRLTEEDGRLHCDDCGVLLALNRQPKIDLNYTEKQVED